MTTKLVSKTQKAITVIALKAKEDPECKFTSLAHLLIEDFLKECFRELKKGKSPGIDGVTVGEYAKKLDENITDLVARLKTKQYKPQPVLRVYIPKSNGDKRPLGIPAVEDKIVQMSIKMILGFRPSSGGIGPVWLPDVVKAIGSEGKGIEEIAGLIAGHRKFQEESGRLEQKRRARLKRRIRDLVEEQLQEGFWNEQRTGVLERELGGVIERQMTPYDLATKLIKDFRRDMN